MAPVLGKTNTIVPSRFHAPPDCWTFSLMTNGAPPESETLLSFPPEKNPISRLSGDQNGKRPPSVPASCLAADESRDRTQRLNSGFDPLLATKTMCRPSGETSGNGA